MRLRTAPAILALAALGACQTYTPAPPHPEAFPAALTARTLAEKPVGVAWTGADLLAVALANNPQIAEAAAKYRTALAAARAARVRPAATLTLSAEYSNEAQHWLYGGGSDIPLDYGARRAGRLSAADLAALQALYDYQAAVWTVRTELTKARSELLSSQVESGMAGRAAQARRLRAERLDRRVEAGEDARPLALLAHTEALAADRRRTDALNRHDQAQIALAKALGVGRGAVGRLVLAPLVAAPMPADPGPARQNALLGRSDVLRAIADYDLAEGALRTEIARQYPEVHIGPGYTYDHGVRKLPLNLTLVLPPADLNRAAIAQAEAKRAEAGRSLDAVQANIVAQIDQAAAALAGAKAQIDIIQARDIPTAVRAYDSARRGLEAGEGDRTDVLAAQAAGVEAELLLLDAHKATEAATIDLEDALRQPFDPAERDVLQAAFRRLGDHP